MTLPARHGRVLGRVPPRPFALGYSSNVCYYPVRSATSRRQHSPLGRLRGVTFFSRSFCDCHPIFFCLPHLVRRVVHCGAPRLRRLCRHEKRGRLPVNPPPGPRLRVSHLAFLGNRSSCGARAESSGNSRRRRSGVSNPGAANTGSPSRCHSAAGGPGLGGRRPCRLHSGGQGGASTQTRALRAGVR